MIIHLDADGFFHIYDDDDPNIPELPEGSQTMKALGFQMWDDKTGEIIAEEWFTE